MSKLSGLREEVAQRIALEQTTGVNPRCTGGEEVEAACGLDDADRRLGSDLTAKDVDQAFAFRAVEHSGQGRVSQVGVDEQGHEPGVHTALGQLGCQRGFALATASTRDEEAMPVASRGIGSSTKSHSQVVEALDELIEQALRAIFIIAGDRARPAKGRQRGNDSQDLEPGSSRKLFGIGNPSRMALQEGEEAHHQEKDSHGSHEHHLGAIPAIGAGRLGHKLATDAGDRVPCLVLELIQGIFDLVEYGRRTFRVVLGEC